ncbi:MAG: TonB family protein [Flavobacteriales bacterium]|nr:TonB family protein [Flavobacteriales bacterium]
MSESKYIHDDFGNQIPLLDAYGNLSMQVIMLYTEDKLTGEDRKIVDAFVATDEMSKDALEGYALTQNASKTRFAVGELNAGIQKRSGAKAVSTLVPAQEEKFDYRKLAAAIALLVVLGGGTFYLSTLFTTDELAVNTEKEVDTSEESANTTRQDQLQQTTIITDSVPLEDTEKDKTIVDEVNELRTEPLERKPLAKGTVTEVAEKKVIELEPELEIAEAEEIATLEDNDARAAADDSKNITTSTLAGNGVVENQKDDLASGATAEYNMYDTESAAEDKMQKEAAELAEMKAEEIAEQRKAESSAMAKAKQAESERKEREMSAMMESSTPVQASNSVATFPGGEIKMYRFIERKKNYTEAMQNQGLEGTVTVSFDIESDGRVSNVRLKKGVNGILDEDAIRVVRSMPKWDPAIENGIAVKSSKSVVVKYGN